MDELGRISTEDFKDAEKNKIIVILDNIRSMNNVGSIFRTADAFLITAIYLCGYTPRPPHREIQKTALGATETVDWSYFENAADAIASARTQGFRVLAVEQAVGSMPLQHYGYEAGTQTAIVLGNEVEGVEEGLLPLCDGCLEIPQLGTKHSLNVAVAAGIVLWKLCEPIFLGNHNEASLHAQNNPPGQHAQD